jgi:hypothetical protein
VVHVRENVQFTNFANSGARFHFQEFNAKARRRNDAKKFLKTKRRRVKDLDVFASLRLGVKSFLLFDQISD